MLRGETTGRRRRERVCWREVDGGKGGNVEDWSVKDWSVEGREC